MNNAFALVSFFLMSMFATYKLSMPADRRYMMRIVFAAWIIIFPTILLVDSSLQFAGGGDDFNYYRISSALTEFRQLLDISILSRSYAQAGYPWVLNLVNLTLNPGLIGFKGFNFLCFLLLVLVWYRIVAELEPAHVARVFALCCMMLTPLWFYFYFLLKDLPIALLQALFVFGLVKTWRRHGAMWGWLIQLTAMAGLIPFRAPLVAQNVAVGAASYVLRWLAPGSLSRKLLVPLVGLSVLAAIFMFASNPDYVALFGISDENRVAGTEAMLIRGEDLSRSSRINRYVFPFVYLFSELSGLSIFADGSFDSARLRGLLALPWILLVLPMLPLGLHWLLRRSRKPSNNASLLDRVLATRILATPWVVIILFILASMAVSWVAGDTTRWRLADMPALLAVAVAGYSHARAKTVLAAIAFWVLGIGCLLSAYYLYRGF